MSALPPATNSTSLHSSTVNSWLYSKVAYVPQKPVIFDESIFYNMTYGWSVSGLIFTRKDSRFSDPQ